MTNELLPPLSTFRLVMPSGELREFEGRIVPVNPRGDGKVLAAVEIVGLVRAGSIFDAEGAD